jgi:DNA-binding CsgD family transcriptional regulator
MTVMIEPAQPAELLPMTLRLHGLSAREREVTGLVLNGRSTREIAQAMFISPYTVQDHLKVIFDKVGVRSRRELRAALASR